MFPAPNSHPEHFILTKQPSGTFCSHQQFIKFCENHEIMYTMALAKMTDADWFESYHVTILVTAQLTATLFHARITE
jgi:hypothetical protein